MWYRTSGTPLSAENSSVPSCVSKNRLPGSYWTRVGSRASPNSSWAASGRTARKRRMQTDSGVSVPSTPASAVPYSDAES